MCSFSVFFVWQGFFVGVSLEAGILVSRTDVNEAFYGGRVSTMDLLMGRVSLSYSSPCHQSKLRCSEAQSGVFEGQSGYSQAQSGGLISFLIQ